MAKDREGRDVFLADSTYVLQMAQMDFKHIKFHFTSAVSYTHLDVYKRQAFILLYKLLRLIFIAAHMFSTFISLFILLFMMLVAFKRNSCSKLIVGSVSYTHLIRLLIVGA